MAVLLRLPEVRKRVGLSTPTIYRLMKKGEFPRSVKLTPNGRAVAWKESDVDAWSESRPGRGEVA
ncbi:helix-turn-helix transcriptional regulator [Halomonas ramblicola]|uniref:helix-turn-helix transcriptional regulator n=1 Tax=Halomonas ramblicola TaxID=747349 RepID=UPI0025B4FD85|nr:AlpA family transcriptional regulator [Halomonas ramblicola]MDN3523525.1 AlpA family transcriptional regulator [Halomonas ramblicola]